MDKFHLFTKSISGIELPERFTYPFHYTPHPLCVMAAEEVQGYLKGRIEWKEELDGGKMFGVLIVKKQDGKVGYLAAFSGNLAGKNLHAYFVPPIYDLLQPDGFFRVEEDQITAINARITELETSPDYQTIRQRAAREEALAQEAISKAKEELKTAKEERELRRQGDPDEAELAALIKESQFQKAELKRLERSWKEQIDELRSRERIFVSQIEDLKRERKTRSATLQQRLFEQFRILDAWGKVKDLCEIFAPTLQKTPPAGAGECAAPKLLQYAFTHGFEPIAMAEFWWGESPKTELRRHGYYYPACKGKCEPILGHMLQGLDVDPNPLAQTATTKSPLQLLFEDEWLVVINKPAGMLSVPGKGEADSVFRQLQARYPKATGPMIVHRLDMATSGLLLIAKTKDVHQHLQAQFKNRTVKKRYLAIIDGIPSAKEGIIELPLCPDPLDRPRQVVSEEYGKPAITRYQTLKRSAGKTWVAFYPQTGRTHQLRVHSAHPSGLNCPIMGDELYGKKADRLYLHAEYLEFIHPRSGETIRITCPCPFI